MNRRALMLGAVTMLAASAVSVRAEGSIMVMNASLRPPVVASTKVGAFYMMLMNHGAEADKLLSITTPVAESVEIHQSVEEGSVASMKPVASFELPAGAMVEFKTGGYHGMVMGLKQDLKPGDTVLFTLKFEKAGDVSVTAKVDAIGATQDHTHGAEQPASSN